LVAEDNPDTRELVAAYMNKGGYEAVFAENGEAAVEEWERGDFSLILMDGQMPEMDGLEATAYIREQERGRDLPIPIIALTAHAQPSDRERFLRAGMTDFLTKPVTYRDLVTAIERYRNSTTVSAGGQRE
jgi:CheY-like chemotaxis protein